MISKNIIIYLMVLCNITGIIPNINNNNMKVNDIR